MYNLYNFEPKQGFLENFRMAHGKHGMVQKFAELSCALLILAASFIWLWI